jgi:hypothetical protein
VTLFSARGRERAHASLGVGLAVVASPYVARASEPLRGVDLEWHAAPGCPDETWARDAVGDYLGKRKLDAVKPITVRVEITPAPGGRWRAELLLGAGATGDRRFEGATCARVSDAAVLIVALMVDPVEVVTRIDSPRAEPRRDVLSAGEVRPQTERERASVVSIGVQATADAGSLPLPSAGGGIAVGLRLGRALIDVDVVAWVPRRALRGPAPGSGGEIGLTTAGLRGCFVALQSAPAGVGVAPCLRVEGGLAHGRGFGIAEPASASNFWGAVFLGASVHQLTSASLGAWLSIEAGMPFVSPRYVIEDFGTVFRAGPLLGRVSLGLGWSFP